MEAEHDRILTEWRASEKAETENDAEKRRMQIEELQRVQEIKDNVRDREIRYKTENAKTRRVCAELVIQAQIERNKGRV